MYIDVSTCNCYMCILTQTCGYTYRYIDMPMIVYTYTDILTYMYRTHIHLHIHIHMNIYRRSMCVNNQRETRGVSMANHFAIMWCSKKRCLLGSSKSPGTRSKDSPGKWMCGKRGKDGGPRAPWLDEIPGFCGN
jgi:hypothetical protein